MEGAGGCGLKRFPAIVTKSDKEKSVTNLRQRRGTSKFWPTQRKTCSGGCQGLKKWLCPRTRSLEAPEDLLNAHFA